MLNRSGDTAKPRVSLLDVAASNINGNTINSSLHVLYRGKPLPLNDANKAELRNKYSEVDLVNLDKTSMVSSKLFYQTYKLKYILLEKVFYLVENLFWFVENSFMNLWRKFKLEELDQVMRQDDEGFGNLLNKIRVGENYQNVEQVVKSRFIDKNDPAYPNDVYIFLQKTWQLKNTMTIN